MNDQTFLYYDDFSFSENEIKIELNCVELLQHIFFILRIFNLSKENIHIKEMNNFCQLYFEHKKEIQCLIGILKHITVFLQPHNSKKMSEFSAIALSKINALLKSQKELDVLFENRIISIIGIIKDLWDQLTERQKYFIINSEFNLEISNSSILILNELSFLVNDETKDFILNLNNMIEEVKKVKKFNGVDDNFYQEKLIECILFITNVRTFLAQAGHLIQSISQKYLYIWIDTEKKISKDIDLLHNKVKKDTENLNKLTEDLISNDSLYAPAIDKAMQHFNIFYKTFEQNFNKLIASDDYLRKTLKTSLSSFLNISEETAQEILNKIVDINYITQNYICNIIRKLKIFIQIKYIILFVNYKVLIGYIETYALILQEIKIEETDLTNLDERQRILNDFLMIITQMKLKYHEFYNFFFDYSGNICFTQIQVKF